MFFLEVDQEDGRPITMPDAGETLQNALVNSFTYGIFGGD